MRNDPDRSCKRSDCLCPSKNGQGDPFLLLRQGQRGAARSYGATLRRDRLRVHVFRQGLDHIDNYLRTIKARYSNVRIMQVPHWNLSRALRIGFCCVANPNVKIMSLKDIDESVRMKTGISYSFYGMKQADGMHRRLMLRGYENEAISNMNKVYPLSHWKKSDVLAYIKARRLPEPIAYTNEAGNGLWFDAKCFDYLRRHYPQDLEKIYKVFPLSRNILLRYDAEKAAAQIQTK